MLESLFNIFFEVLKALSGLEFFIGLIGACSFYALVGLFKCIVLE